MLADAGALLALSSTANAGITIPAGEWTLDISGVVNAYYTSTHASGDVISNTTGRKNESNITTGLLPNVLAVSGKTRQNDLDVAFTIAIDPGTSNTGALQYKDTATHATQENRQAFLTVGDASWGSVKFGKDLGIYASDAILNDMTLLGVGSGAGAFVGNTTTLGRIGTGYVYADWKPQIAYTSPNWNGFSFTAGVTQAWNADTSNGRGGNQPAFEGKASYAWTGDVAGKVWVSGISQKVQGIADTTETDGRSSSRSSAIDIGATINVAGFGLTGYYNNGNGIGTLGQLLGAYSADGKKRDSDDWYVQATYVLPTATKIGLAYGESTLDGNRVDTYKDTKNEMWTVGAYHPLTKSVNLVAEYSDQQLTVDRRVGSNLDTKAKTVSLGAILFF